MGSLAITPIGCQAAAPISGTAPCGRLASQGAARCFDRERLRLITGCLQRAREMTPILPVETTSFRFTNGSVLPFPSTSLWHIAQVRGKSPKPQTTERNRVDFRLHRDHSEREGIACCWCRIKHDHTEFSEFTVSLRRTHLRALHRAGDEAACWQTTKNAHAPANLSARPANGKRCPADHPSLRGRVRTGRDGLEDV
jgi:hypothetical protein